jgi:Ca-activated chloride channel homolog
MEMRCMSLLLLVSLTLMAVAAAAARFAPHIVTPAARIPIALERVGIRSELDGTTATTTVEMVFRNPNHRPLEGELRLPQRP